MGIFTKTFGGLSNAVYVRHFLFGLPFYALSIVLVFGPLDDKLDSSESKLPLLILSLFFCTCLQFLYPFSRFVFEGIGNFILGDHEVIIENMFYYAYRKFISIFLCWTLSFLIAPLGLIYLYFHHSKREKLEKEKPDNG